MYDLLFYLFGFSCFANVKLRTDLLVWLSSVQSNRHLFPGNVDSSFRLSNFGHSDTDFIDNHCYSSQNDPNVVLGSYVVASSRGVTSKSHVNVVRYFVSWKFLESVRQGLMWCHASNRLQFFKFFPSTFLTKIIFPLFSSRGTNGGGISVTQSSGSPYLHGRPRFPVQQPQHQTQTPSGMGMQVQYPQYTFSTGGGAPTGATSSQQHHHHQQQQLELQQLQLQQQQLMNGQGGYLQQQGMSNNGFTPVSLSVPVSSGGMVSIQQQSLPVQAIRPIQPVQVLYNKTLHVVNPKPKV